MDLSLFELCTSSLIAYYVPLLVGVWYGTAVELGDKVGNADTFSKEFAFSHFSTSHKKDPLAKPGIEPGNLGLEIHLV